MTSKELAKGIKVEMEHKNLFPKNLQKTMAKRIAETHIKEDKHYYEKLSKAGL